MNFQSCVYVEELRHEGLWQLWNEGKQLHRASATERLQHIDKN